MELKILQEQQEAPLWMTEDGFTTLSNGYLLPDETPKQMWLRVSNAAAIQLKKPELAEKFFDLFWNNILCGASPVLSNMGTARGLPISCLTGDTWLNTKYNGVMMQNVQIGDELLTHEGRYRKVIAKTSRMSNDDLYSLRVGTRTTKTKITGNHPVLTNLGWVRVDELDSKKHFVATNSEINYTESNFEIDMLKFCDYESKTIDGLINKVSTNKLARKRPPNGLVSYYTKIKEKVPITLDLAWAFGIWFAEGSKTVNEKKNPNGCRITMGQNEIPIIQRWLDVMYNSFNVNGGILKAEASRENFSNGKLTKWASGTVNSGVIGNLFASFGNNCKDKVLPDWIVDLPKSHLDKFLEGMLEGDGHFTKSDAWSITLSNPKLLLGLYNICLKLGISVSLQMQTKPSKIGKTKYVYVLRNLAVDRIELNKFNYRSGIVFGKLRFCPILGLEKLKENAEVFDIQVEGDHSFSANGFIVHNCNTIHISDSCDSIFKKQHELAMLSKNGAGVGIYVGDIRGRGASITGNGKSEGLIPWLKCFDSTTMAISQGCYDDQTEILTEYGWKLFKDLPSCKTTVAQINENNEIEFTKYSDFISYHVDEELFHFTNTIQSVDMLVTGNHNMLVEHKKRITNKRDSAGKFINHEKRWGNKLHSVRADAVKLHNCNRMWTSAPSSVRNNLKLSPEDQFAIAYQADGSTNPVGSSNGKISGTLLHTFHFSKERKISRLKEILDSIGYFYTTSIQADSNTTFFVRIPEFKVPSKNLSDEFKLNEMSAQFAQDFIQEIGHWDGSFRTESGDDGISYSCVIQDNIDFVQAVATLAGYFTNKGITANREGNRQDLHTLLVSFNRHSVGGEYLEVKKKHYNGMVYCVTVPSHKLVVRRGGRTLICGNSTRRGASAVYLPADHLDIEEFLQIRRPTGDVNRRCANLHHAVCIDDAFIGRLKSKDSHTRNIWKEILKTRYEAGEPYLLFTDNVNRQLPISYQKLNLKVKSSNICSEIMLYTDNDHTFVCCLSSLNLTTYHKWKGTDAVQLSIWFLDGVIQEYIEKAKGKSGLEAAVRFAEKSRAVGLGVLGWHSLLQQQKIAFESFAAMQLNAEIFRYIQSEAQIATQELAKVYGEVEWTKDCGVRNTHLMALAPTVSNSIISGDHSAGIEPFTANVFSQKTAKGTFLKFNAQLKQMLQEKGKDSLDTWKSINEYDGSVQHLNFLSDDEKSLFKTGIEIDQEVIVRQAAQRQKWVDQGQSLNLFFSKSVDPRYIHKVHLLAHELNLKSLYYMRTQSILKGDSVSRQQDEDVCKACEG